MGSIVDWRAQVRAIMQENAGEFTRLQRDGHDPRMLPELDPEKLEAFVEELLVPLRTIGLPDRLIAVSMLCAYIEIEGAGIRKGGIEWTEGVELAKQAIIAKELRRQQDEHERSA